MASNEFHVRAARGGQVEAIQMLLGKGADLHAIDDVRTIFKCLM